MRKNEPISNHADQEDHGHPEWCPRLDRRAAVRLLSLSALAGMAGCGSGGTASGGTSAGKTTTATTLTPSATSASAGASVTLTAAVAPAAATGSVTFYNGSASLGVVAMSSGAATLATSFATAGTEVLTAMYGGSTTYDASTSTGVDVVISGSASCSASLEGEEGPYFVDDSATGYNRVNILSNLDGTETQTGVPLALTIYVFDSKNGCAPMQGVQVDIWHCNASGVYSAESSESTSSESWLRGYQLTDATGKVEFTTISLDGIRAGPTTFISASVRPMTNQTTAARIRCRHSSSRRWTTASAPRWHPIRAKAQIRPPTRTTASIRPKRMALLSSPCREAPPQGTRRA